jgi:NDP-sugar pyrophosphorylase family protein
MAGEGARFRKEGVLTPKQLLPAGGRSCLERSLDSFLNLSNFKIVFGVNDESVAEATIAYAKANKLDAQTIHIGKTQAPTETLQIMTDLAIGLEDDARLYVFTMDAELFPAITIDAAFSAAGVTYVFTSNNPSYSYVKIDEGRVTNIAEKKVISEHANVGLYGFRTLRTFKSALKQCEDIRRAEARETHVSDMIRLMLAEHRFETRSIEGIYVFGTPQEYDFYTQHILPQRRKQLPASNMGHFKDGWLVGAFDPALVKTKDVEIGVKKVAKGHKSDGHYHKITTEHTVILEGKAENNGHIFSAGDIITLRPLERNHTVFLEESLILCIKTPSAMDDKYD